MGSSDKVDKASKVDKKIKDKSDKKDKKDKKRSESDGIRKESKDKKKEKAKRDKLLTALDQHLVAQEATGEPASPKEAETAAPTEETTSQELVYFAYPLADEKIEQKKVYKLVKKGNKMKALYRGTKEVEKAIKKCPVSAPAKGEPPAGIVIIAGDIFPVEVIEHFPMLCEEHHVPYLFVRSRLALGEAAGTKRATSVIMLKREPKKSAGELSEDDKEKVKEYYYMYDSMAEWAQKEWLKQVQPWVTGNHPTLLAMQAAERIA